MVIHPTAVVDSGAEIDAEASIGPYTVIEAGVRVGAGTRIGPHVCLHRGTALGRDCVVSAGVVLGDAPQHTGYDGAETSLVLGDRNVIREHVTIHRALEEGNATRIGNDNFFMAGSHAGHDCQIGNGFVLTVGAMLAGHVTVEDQVTIAGNAGVHQHLRIGKLAFVAGAAKVNRDVPPYVMLEGRLVRAMNVVGMRRAGMSAEVRERIAEAYRILYRRSRSLEEGLQRIEELGPYPEIQHILEFLRGTVRGISWQKRRARGAMA